VVERADGRALLREAYVVYLRATVQTLVDRVGSGADRPWLDGDPAQFFQRQYEQRGTWFEQVADLVLDVDAVDVPRLAKRIVEEASGLRP
jgi:shikimate kinase